jgi:hypothetical protein
MFFNIIGQFSSGLPNTACTPFGTPYRAVRQFAWIEAGSDKMTFSRPAQQPVTPAVGQPKDIL